MIKDDMTPFQYRVTFKDSGVERLQFTDDRRYYEGLVSQHGHLTDLSVSPLTLTADQENRLSEAKAAELSPQDASVYVRFATAESEDSSLFDLQKFEAYQRAQVEPEVRAQRKEAEAHGVMLNGIRYAGDPGNRQALQEAISSAEDSGTQAFGAWKDSDNEYRTDHPVSEVKDALRLIGARRSALIALEALYVAQVAAGEADIKDLDWATEYD